MCIFIIFSPPCVAGWLKFASYQTFFPNRPVGLCLAGFFVGCAAEAANDSDKKDLIEIGRVTCPIGVQAKLDLFVSRQARLHAQFSKQTKFETMEVCDYPCSDQDPGSLLSQLGQHPDEIVSEMPGALIPMPAPSPMEKCDQIVVLDSSRIAMQIASGQIVWPIVPKPKEIIPKLEPDIYPFSNANGTLHPDLESTDLALGQLDTPLEKCKVRKRPRSASEDAEGPDGEGPNERQAIMRWKDTWVAQLIHVRGRMQAAFSGPQKQRIDLWQVIKNEMARTCPGFDKDSEACRKKWRRVYKEYRDEKTLHNAGDGSQKCRFYELLEYYMGERVDGTSEPPVCLGLSVKEEMIAVKSEAVEADIGEAYAMRKPRKRVKRQEGSAVDSESLQSMISELVGIGKEMLQTTRQFEQDKLEILHSLRETLREISGKI